ncbi:hypothetical protein MJO28_015605 [Puccinia striiformis f. sp. tritici]|uniref:Uncharacterized protein n=2 Tax=Puccinia striiformis f. sp. tritici TaxID=168172 RepID=A0A0L0VNY5_9BASI|nr:hypothetical protein Pst134EA_029398 [Puccinia striiformis f. sp. tritici]KAI9614358.1 hypothetical protein H4Q26_009506 [Puccinia striiformis f. sp. tritici PST-130]KNF00956.1 hypothetical protein PSTG_05851 [Puccinia striiformis f. sp. tritici PST-78]KAH9441383.1 hypothetical protein Pst134EB_030049 [Puccinia striiformis f. sp. tritici]KAH9447359.1 hypothetical protein Pst134EA_029398 [Puccinia striiformis f. sp. tritici]KAI7936706.1 hypothetical protein MJO28_015605 [Puccinia striiformis
MSSFPLEPLPKYGMCLASPNTFITRLIILCSILTLARGVPMQVDPTIRRLELLNQIHSPPDVKLPGMERAVPHEIPGLESDGEESPATFQGSWPVENSAIARSFPSENSQVETEHKESLDLINLSWSLQNPAIKMVRDFRDVENSFMLAQYHATEEMKVWFGVLEEQLQRIRGLLLRAVSNAHLKSLPKNMLPQLFRTTSNQEDYGKNVLGVLKDLLLATTNHDERMDTDLIMHPLRKAIFLAINLMIEYSIVLHNDVKMAFQEDELQFVRFVYRTHCLEHQVDTELACRNAEVAFSHHKLALQVIKEDEEKLGARGMKMNPSVTPKRRRES